MALARSCFHFCRCRSRTFVPSPFRHFHRETRAPRPDPLQYNGKTPLFQELNLSLEGNDFVLIQGPSGSGKSSFLRLFNRLQEPTSGLILIDEKPASEHDVRQLRRRIGYVQQTPTMMPGTVRENLNLAYKFKAACTERIPDDGTLRQKQRLCIVLVTHMHFQLHLVCPRKFLLNQKGFQKVDA